MQLSILKYSLLLIWLISSGTLWASNTQVLSPLPKEVTEKWNNFSLVGQTTLRRFGFHVYDSSFWTITDKSDDIKSADLINCNSCALSITYARKISAKQLLSSTKKEWQRLGFAGRYPLDAWLTMLKNSSIKNEI